MKFFSLTLLLLFIFSCSNKEKRLAVLPANKMKEVMWDMIRADQYVSDFIMKDSTRNKKNESIKLYDEIFQIHKITREQFKKSLDYYSSRPDLLKPIIDSLAIRRNDFAAPFHPLPSLNPVKTIHKDSLSRPPHNLKP
jgi:hypothetical protein